MHYNRNAGVAFQSGSTVHAIALHLTAEKAAALKGSRVVGIRTAFGTRLADSLQVFACTTPGGTPLTSARFTGVGGALQDYLFDTPLEVDGSELFLGYTFYCKDALHRPLLFDQTSDFPSDVVYAQTDEGWTDVTRTGNGAPIIQLVLENVREDYRDVALKDCSLSGTLKQGSDYTFVCHVTNLSFVPVTTLSASTSSGGGRDEMHTVGGLDIAPGATAEVALRGNVGDVSGPVNLSLSLLDVNGIADAAPSDNRHEESQWVAAPEEHRRVLVEKFTGQACKWCSLGDAVIAEAQKTNDYVVVAHHTFGTDQFSMTESYAYAKFFGVTSYPSLVVNRLPFTATSAVVGLKNGLTEDLAEATLQAERRPIDLNIDLGNTFDPLTRQGCLTVSIHTFRTLSDAPHALHVWLTQDSIAAFQSGEGNDYLHNHTFRGVIAGDAWGQPVTLNAGETSVFSFPYRIPDAIVSSASTDYSFAAIPEQMHLVAFVSDVTDSPLTSIVHNAAEIGVTESTAPSAVTETAAMPAYTPVLEADGTLRINGTYATARVYAADGRQECVLTQGQTVRLSGGLHVLRIDGHSYKLVCR